MQSILNEKIAIGYVCCGPTYRESLKDKLENLYFDDDNIYYCVLTDDKEYFKDIQRKNLYVNELKDFYEEFPNLERNEKFLESDDKNDYAKKFVTNNYLFSFSTYRFLLLMAYRLEIKNVSMLCTDTYINFDVFNNSFFENKNYFYNATSEWDDYIWNRDMHLVAQALQLKFNLLPDQKVRILDAAGRLYIAESLEHVKELFDIWNTVVEHLYQINYMHVFRGTYVINDEYILGPIYNVLNLNKREVHCNSPIFVVKHAILKERFWRVGGGGEIKEHTNWEEFLEINNLKDGDY
jgi:hypothetical protein